MANNTKAFVASRGGKAWHGYVGRGQELLLGSCPGNRRLRRKLEKQARKAGKGEDGRK